MTLDELLKQYYNLDKLKKQLEVRLKELNTLIKKEMMSSDQLVYKNDEHTAKLEVRRKLPKIQDSILEDFLRDRGLWDISHKSIPDREIVHGFWRDGIIADEDIRSMLPNPENPNTALYVDKVSDV